MVFENGVKNIQAAAYNSVGTVDICEIRWLSDCTISWLELYSHKHFKTRLQNKQDWPDNSIFSNNRQSLGHLLSERFI